MWRRASEWRDKFVAYKRLKRLVSAGESSTRRAAAEVAFVRMLDGEVNRFNSFFLELEQEFVIRHRVRVHVFILYERGRVA
jgi:SPX domain protein involved in polyphosphate accumulation